MTTPGVSDWLARAEAAQAGGDIRGGLAAAQAAWDSGGGWRAGVLRAHFLYRSGALAAAVDAGLAALPLGLDAAAAERFDLLRMVALAAVEAGRFDAALNCAQQALRIVPASSDPGRLALGVNALACCFERMGDPWQAERLMADALAAARASKQPHPLMATLNNLVAVQIGMYHLMRDASSAGAARAPLERALPHAREAVALVGPGGDDIARISVAGNLGEVLLHLGLLGEARASIETALAIAQRIGARAQAVRMGCSLGELDLAEGRPQAAWQRLVDLLAAAQPDDLRLTRLRIHHALWRTARALKRNRQALEHLEQYLRLERERGLSQLQAQSELFVTRAETEQWHLESRRDQLTQLANRREAEQRWPVLLEQARRDGTPLAVALADLDEFKRINDRYGHAVGDRVLVAMAGILRDNTRGADLVARLGGEEFLLVLPETAAERAHEVCERLRQRVAAHDWNAVADGLQVTTSIGLTTTPPFDAEVLTARADAALYAAKRAGRDRVALG
jgi:diguanylate cyclase (GGDEF)-like protein